MAEVNKPLLYSRQTRILGANSIQTLAEASVLIINLHGIGAETAKNVILAGVGKVHLHDTQVMTFQDLSSHAFCNAENSVGKNRAEESRSKLQELNPYSQVQVENRPLTIELLRCYTTVVYCTQYINSTVFEVANMCRCAAVNFVLCTVSGLLGSVFEDFGMGFASELHSGRATEEIPIKALRSDSMGTWVVSNSTLDRLTHGIELGSYVKFVGVEELEAAGTCLVNQCNFLGEEGEFLIDAKFDRLPSLVGQRPFAEVAFLTKSFSFVCLSEFLKTQTQQITHPHVVLQVALGRYYDKHQKLPRPRNALDTMEFAKFVTLLQEELDCKESWLDEEYIATFAKTCVGNIIPMVGAFGGFAAQEVIKSITHKFTPLSNQWLDYSYLTDFLTEDAAEAEYQPLNCRYDGQISIFGRAMQSLLADHNALVVGAGALGCEVLKNCAVAGVSVGKGVLHCVDNDTIALSNLHRQLLFREKDIAKSKSEVARASVLNINHKCNIEAYPLCFDEQSCCQKFTVDMCKDLNSMFSLVDSVESRRFIYLMSCLYDIPMINAGTHALEGSTHLFVPNLTAQYRGSSMQAECAGDIGIPYLKQHAVKWALGQFNDMFHSTPKQIKENLGEGFTLLADLNKWIARKFDKFFVEDILAILNAHPQNDSFWQGHKLAPELLDSAKCSQHIANFNKYGIHLMTAIYGEYLSTGNVSEIIPVAFDKDNEDHLAFLESAARLYAACFHINLDDREYIRAVAGNIQPAIMTTTSIVSGLTMMNLYNVCLKNFSLDVIKNTSVNTAKSVTSLITPCGGPPLLYALNGISDWDLESVLKKIEQNFELPCGQLKLLNSEMAIIHDYYPAAKRAALLKASMGDVLKRFNAEGYCGSPYFVFECLLNSPDGKVVAKLIQTLSNEIIDSSCNY